MTLRHRLLLVYGVVVLLSVATVGVAVFELRHAGQIIRELQRWNDTVLNIRKLRESFPPASPEEDTFPALLAGARLNMMLASEYLDVEQVREAFNDVHLQYQRWLRYSAEIRRQRGAGPFLKLLRWLGVPADIRQQETEGVRIALEELVHVVDGEVAKLDREAARQDARTPILLFVVMCLTVLHVAVVGSLLRRWLLNPMEQLNRQVEALAHDEAPSEPLLKSPQEMARLAEALDKARHSLGSLRQQLIESERLTTIGQLSAQLAHNLRNPLASIRAAAQVTSRHADGNDPTRRRMEDIIAAVDRLNQWIAGLMEFARREATPSRSLDVTPTLEKVREALAADMAVKDLQLAIDGPADGLVCEHDPATLEHALIAMLVNAIEASPMGATITLRGEYIENAENTSCRISVVDSGSGLPADDPERIFESSYSTKQRGMGLGLSLARLALERQGGSVHACNRPSGGAMVYVDLPVQIVAAGTERSEPKVEKSELRIA